jgi:hypothetical protein
MKFSSSDLPFLEPIFFWSLIFGSYWLIVTWCIVLLLQLCLVSFWVSLSISHFLFLLHGYTMNRGGVLVYSRRYPKYSRRTLPWILSHITTQFFQLLGESIPAGIFKKKKLAGTFGLDPLIQWILQFFPIVALVHKTPYVKLYQYYCRTL